MFWIIIFGAIGLVLLFILLEEGADLLAQAWAWLTNGERPTERERSAGRGEGGRWWLYPLTFFLEWQSWPFRVLIVGPFAIGIASVVFIPPFLLLAPFDLEAAVGWGIFLGGLVGIVVMLGGLFWPYVSSLASFRGKAGGGGLNRWAIGAREPSNREIAEVNNVLEEVKRRNDGINRFDVAL